MAEAHSPKEEQSMEEILQSIKRIIADDEQKEVSETAPPPPEKSKMEVEESDILELTDIVAQGAEHTAKEEPPMDDMTHDVLKMIDAKLEEPPMPTPHAASNDILADIDSLLNEEAVKSTTDALQNLKMMQQKHTIPVAMPSPSPSFRSGLTIEDLVLEALKPELKAWLNANLPAMVERMIAAEIKKISSNN